MDDHCTGHSHDHEQNEDQLGLSLRPQIDIPNVTCLNELIPGSCRLILKLHEERMTINPNLLSPIDDPELLLYIPFTEAVTIQSITIHNSSNNNTNACSPKRIKLYTNRDDLDFDAVRELPSQQEIELLSHVHFEEGTIDYPCRPAGRFQGITSLTIFVVDNFSTVDGDDDNDDVLSTEITFIGLKGKGTNMKRMAVNAVYETQGMYEDHKVKGGHFGTKSVL